MEILSFLDGTGPIILWAAVLTINGLGRAGAPTQSIGLRLSPRRLRRVESIYLVCITITNYSCRSGNMLAWDNTAWRGLTRTDALADGPTKGFAVSGAPPPGPGTPCKRSCFLRTPYYSKANHRSVPILSTECDLDQYQIARARNGLVHRMGQVHGSPIRIVVAVMRWG